MAFVLPQHLAPTRGSVVAELVGRCTAMAAVQVRTDTPVEGDHIYCIPPGKYLGISGRTLRLIRMPIHFFLRALAADISRSSVELHRGRLAAAPRGSGGGSTARMLLPLDAAPAGDRDGG